MKRVLLIWICCFLFVAAGTVAGAASAPYAYHLRVVRVSGAGTDPGTAMGWAENGGIPVVMPDEEAWGTPEQLEALADALGGEQADAVTGYYITSDASGAVFDRRVYLSDSVLDLSFEAFPPTDDEDQHLLTLRLDSPESRQPLAEARLLVRTARTVAIACPSPVENDWLVLAVTLVDQARIAGLRHSSGEVRSPDDAGVLIPKVIRKSAPRYPEAARKDGVQGFVVVMATIDKQGVPRAASVVEMSPGAEELAAAAVDTVQAWLYEPGTLNGEPVEVEFTIHVKFKLE